MSRIAILSTSWPTTARAADGPFVAEMARALAARGHEVRALVPGTRPGQSLRAPQGVDLVGVRHTLRARDAVAFHRGGVPDHAREPGRWPALIGFPPALAAALRHGPRPDLILSHWGLPAGLVASVVAPEVRHLGIWHSADVHLARTTPTLARAALRGMDAVWCTGPSKLDLLRGIARGALPDASRIHVGPMPPPALSLPERDAARASLGLDRPTLLTLGRLTPIKGLDVLCAALAGTEWTWLVAGDGPARARLEADARRHRVDARFLGHVEGAEKGRCLAAADFFVQPSTRRGAREEGTPVALLEALRAGLPAVVTNTGDMPRWVDGAGVAVAPDDGDALRLALDQLMGDPSRRARYAETARGRMSGLGWDDALARALAMVGVRY